MEIFSQFFFIVTNLFLSLSKCISHGHKHNKVWDHGQWKGRQGKFAQSIVNEVCITTKRIVGCQGFKEKMKFKFVKTYRDAIGGDGRNPK
jgi:hypothetical protein